ncbi:2-hydroxychromene-2-carboxylate isomerase [Luminiphilus sp.]|jgi:2-hydroxychromene-2-carboxylate isomerase|nr:2-hydroxychromene-2-carboxylate isomerase [Luminiphilus sp.]
MQLDFFYDLSSPWTYLAFNNLQPIIKETGAVVRWRPFLVGGVFNAVNPGVYEARAVPTDPKVAHNFRWLHEWARLADIPLVFPTEHHPVKSVLAMRVCCALEPQQNALQQFSAAAFDAYFAQGDNIDDPAVLARVADSCGLDGKSLIEQAAEQSIKDQLRGNTDAAIALGAYGSPSLFIADKLYFGNDQLPLVRDILLRGQPSESSR